MPSLDWNLRREGEVTLVELSVRSDREQQVRIESQLRPVWPPRQQGVPIQGWHGHTFEGTVEASRPLVIGYASPAPPTEPPAELTEAGPSPDTSEITPRELVRALGDFRPPRDVLSDSEPLSEATGPDRPPVTDRSSQATTQTAEPAVWFEAVESRLTTTETLAGATDADEIRAAVEAAGGIEAVRDLQAQLDADRRQLRQIRRRSDTLADQLSATELPLATLERVV